MTGKAQRVVEHAGSPIHGVDTTHHVVDFLGGLFHEIDLHSCLCHFQLSPMVTVQQAATLENQERSSIPMADAVIFHVDRSICKCNGQPWLE